MWYTITWCYFVLQISPEEPEAKNLDVKKYFNFILRRLPMAEGNLADDFIESLMT